MRCCANGVWQDTCLRIPLVAMTRKGSPRRPKSLVLSPARELADQIASEMEPLSNRTSITTVYGGVAYGKQVNALKHGTDILVACPGRLEDLMESGTVELDDIERVVIDEADRMADMGFLPQCVAFSMPPHRVLKRSCSQPPSTVMSLIS